jgi:predicted RNA-binding protein YlqC (UPF0109 family)
MNELISFLTKNLTGIEDYSINETEEEGGINYTISVPQEYVGLLIGRGGKTIKAIRNVVKVRATLEQKLVNVSVEEAE